MITSLVYSKYTRRFTPTFLSIYLNLASVYSNHNRRVIQVPTLGRYSDEKHPKTKIQVKISRKSFSGYRVKRLLYVLRIKDSNLFPVYRKHRSQ